MKKFPKPWYRPSRDMWYVTIDGKQYKLAADKDNAFEKYKQILNRPKLCKHNAAPSYTVVAIIDKFLDWYHQN